MFKIKATPKNKEWLYVGHYTDTKDRYILKIGTTNDLERRKQEHTRNYKRAVDYRMPLDSVFEYDWAIPLSKYNTIRFEDLNREQWQRLDIGLFVRNDRFACVPKPENVQITIRKTYTIEL